MLLSSLQFWTIPLILLLFPVLLASKFHFEVVIPPQAQLRMFHNPEFLFGRGIFQKIYPWINKQNLISYASLNIFRNWKTFYNQKLNQTALDVCDCNKIINIFVIINWVSLCSLRIWQYNLLQGQLEIIIWWSLTKNLRKKLLFSFQLESSEQNLWASLVPDPTTKYILQNDLQDRAQFRGLGDCLWG